MWKTSQRMGLAALIMGASVLLSRFMGLIRDKVIAYGFGATPESDIYFAAFVIPDFINYLLAGGYFSITLIPLLAERFQHDEDDAWRLFSAALTWVTLCIVVLTGAAFALAPELARIAAPGFTPEQTARLAHFLRIILPAQVFFLTGACVTALLYLRKQFLVPALSPLVYNGLIILFGAAFANRGMEGFCWGVLVGSLLGNLLLPLIAAKKGGGLRLGPRFRHPGMKRFALLALPLIVGQSIVILDEQLVRVFGSLAGAGAISRLNYARRLMMVPVGVVAQAAGVASYPFLADLFAQGARARFAQTLASALRNTATLLLPLSVWMAAAAAPTVTLIFFQGRFGAADAAGTAVLLQIFLACVVFWGIQQLLGRAFYASGDTLSPAVIGTGATLLALPAYYAATHIWSAHGVALASSVSLIAYTAALAWWFARKFGSEALCGLAPHCLRIAALSLASGIPAWLAASALTRPDSPYLSALAALAGSAFVFGALFLALGRAFAPDALRPFLQRLGPLGKRLAR